GAVGEPDLRVLDGVRTGLRLPVLAAARESEADERGHLLVKLEVAPARARAVLTRARHPSPRHRERVHSCVELRRAHAELAQIVAERGFVLPFLAERAVDVHRGGIA